MFKRFSADESAVLSVFIHNQTVMKIIYSESMVLKNDPVLMNIEVESSPSKSVIITLEATLHATVVT